MARRNYLLAPSALAFAIFGCGGPGDPGLFGGSGVSGAGAAGAASVHGAGASSTPAGSGGDTASAGDVGLGGDAAGGDSGSSNAGGNAGAGHSGSGGSAGRAEGGSAGRAEGGGAGRAAGGTGTGGAAGAGTAGSAANGGAGAGGRAGDPTCAQLLAEATTELAAARVCNLAANAQQCTGKVKTVCNCEVPVENSDSMTTNSYEATLKQINDKHCTQVCPAIACLAVSRPQCMASTLGSAQGTCVAGFGAATPTF